MHFTRPSVTAHLHEAVVHVARSFLACSNVPLTLVAPDHGPLSILVLIRPLNFVELCCCLLSCASDMVLCF